MIRVAFFQSLRHLGLGLFFNLFGCFTSLSTSFLLCYSGSKGSETMMSFGDVAYNVDWYRYPVNIQKMTQLIIQSSNQTACFTGFKILSGTVETFGKVSTKKQNEFGVFLIVYILFTFSLLERPVHII